MKRVDIFMMNSSATDANAWNTIIMYILKGPRHALSLCFAVLQARVSDTRIHKLHFTGNTYEYIGLVTKTIRNLRISFFPL